MGVVEYKSYSAFYRVFWFILFLSEVLYVGFACYRLWLCGGGILARIRLYVKVRVQGGRIDSVPLKQLVRLSGFPKKRWSFEDGWLILEAF